MSSNSTPSSVAPQKKRSRLPLILVLLVSLAPVVAAVLMYNNPQWWPQEVAGVGELVTPQREIPSPSQMPLTTLNGEPFDLNTLKGRWVLLSADDGDCGDDCARKLFITRNVHASQGKNVDRMARMWLITDDQPVPQRVLDAYEGMIMVRGDAGQMAQFLLGLDAPVDVTPEVTQALNAAIWVIDPLGHLMLSFPPGVDPERLRNDVRQLVRNSRIG